MGPVRHALARPPRATLAVLLLIIAATVETADAVIYRWTDTAGRVHYTQDLNRVPAAQRAAAQAAAQEKKPDRLQSYETGSRQADKARPSQAAVRPRWEGGTHVVPFRRVNTVLAVDVTLNDTVTAPFLFDTGASDISLPLHVAEQLGLRIGPDTPTVLYNTANGVVSSPIVELDAVQIGTARMERVRAHVNPSLQIGLLGGTFFNNFIYQIDTAAGVITLRRNEGVRGGYAEAQWRERFMTLRQPLEKIEERLASGLVRRAGVLQKLHNLRDRLRVDLEALEREANRHEVPQTWRY